MTMLTNHENFSMCTCVKKHIDFGPIAKSGNGFEFVGSCAFRNRSYLILKQYSEIKRI